MKKSHKAFLFALLAYILLQGVGLAQPLTETEFQSANPIYVALLALTPIMLFIIGWFSRREVLRLEKNQEASETAREKDRKELQALIEQHRKDTDHDREEIYRNMRIDREQLTTAVTKVADALNSVNMRLVAIEAVVQIRSTTPIPKL